MITILLYTLGCYVGLGLLYIALRWLVILIKDKFFGYYYGDGGFFMNPFPMLLIILISIIAWPIILHNDFDSLRQKHKRKKDFSK